MEYIDFVIELVGGSYLAAAAAGATLLIFGLIQGYLAVYRYVREALDGTED